MRLHLDGIIFSLQSHGGITVYFRELLQRLTADHQATLTLEGPTKGPINSASFAEVRCLERQARTLERLRPVRGIGTARDTVFHSSYYRRPAVSAQPTVVTVHDFVYQRFVHGPMAWLRRWLMNSAVAQARHIICISEATRDDLLEFIPVRPDQRISVIHNGVSDLFRPVAKVAAARPFMLFVGQRGGYKNFRLALRALEVLPDFELHCVGGGPLQPEELSAVPAQTRKRVRHLGFVDDEQLNILYNQAHCLLYPSAYEGFGIPVLEAMRAGCPVVCVACKAVVEVGGAALSIAELPNDPVALADAVQRLDSGDTRSRLQAIGLSHSRQFSWDRCFEQTLAVYRSL